MVIAGVLLIMVAVRVWNRRGPARAQPFTGPLAAALLVAVSGLTPDEVGLTRAGWGYALVAFLIVAAGYGIALLIPAARRALGARNHPNPVRKALLGVPLATVIFEEIAFRGVLWTLLYHDHGAVWAYVVTAVLFGLWHLPAPAEVAFTTLAGFVLSFLREVGGGLIAPFVLHWTANGLGILASAGARRSGPGDSGGDDKSQVGVVPRR
ncbi:CPBP family intramembrane metalloprotease [Actinoplanes sp. NEAU-A12]|uniref:CPBP family intramembrane metalloprotease n=1 Tax=Actinoplanes sandaracinus TaxID=3045177 RepID=A0ABT6WC72_9ACTN|nr:CPBP family intramembrane glutamic endopeptidase [Actinoplanes sandaracinus]MDI6097325.1 CPBP family intramembrane metalloprotease [Actinoplanes sandaracinus]